MFTVTVNRQMHRGAGFMFLKITRGWGGLEGGIHRGRGALLNYKVEREKVGKNPWLEGIERWKQPSKALRRGAVMA